MPADSVQPVEQPGWVFGIRPSLDSSDAVVLHPLRNLYIVALMTADIAVFRVIGEKIVSRITLNFVAAAKQGIPP